MPAPPDPFWTNWVFWIYVAVLLPYLLSLLFYGFRSPWRSSAVGKGLFTLYASLVAVLLFAVIALSGVIPRWLSDVLRVVLLGGVMVAGWIQFAQIVRLQREARRCPDRSTSA